MSLSVNFNETTLSENEFRNSFFREEKRQLNVRLNVIGLINRL